jgi:hypothetical protein
MFEHLFVKIFSTELSHCLACKTIEIDKNDTDCILLAQEMIRSIALDNYDNHHNQ